VAGSKAEMTFWDHLEVLRGTVFRSLLAVVAVSIVVFCFKDFVFNDIVLAPTRSDFFLYRWLGLDMDMTLINVDISAQFFVHMKVAAAIGFIISFPYICYEVWKFVAPALYENEKAAIRKTFGLSGILFYLGLVVGYVVILPITLSFFQNYSVSDAVQNQINLNSYISLFTSMVLLFGIVFEFPIAIMVLSSMGLVTRSTLRKYRRYAIVVILIIAAIITPADPFSMLVAAAPLYLLYEASVILCRKESKQS
jgi:sec-independent protein translocase protein TatC